MVKAFICDQRLVVQLPLLPIARYRSRVGEHPVRIEGLFDALRGLPMLPFSGKLLLTLYHYHSATKSYQKIPDFDNYDCKYLIDCICSFYGGDHPLRLSILHLCSQGNALPEGTYAILQEEPASISVADVEIFLVDSVQKNSGFC